MKTALLCINSAAIFIFLYSLWGFISKERRRLKFYNIGAMVDEQVKKLIEQYPRAKGLVVNIKKMLDAATLRVKGKPPKLLHFLFVTLLFFVAVLVATTVFLNNPVAGLLIGGVGATIPYHILQFDYKQKQKKLRKQTAQFLLAVSNMFSTYGDPMVALEELSSRLKMPLRREIVWFVNNMKYGVSAQVCVDTVKSRLPDRILRDFFNDLLFYLKHGGDFQYSVSILVKQTYERQMAAVERGAATSSTVMVFLVLVGVYFMLLFTLSNTQPEIVGFLIDTTIGKLVSVIMIAIFMVAGYFTKMMVSIDED